MPDSYLMQIDAPGITLMAQPGQFIMVQCGRELLLRRPFSIHRVAKKGRNNEFYLLFAQVGKGTFWLSQRKVGDKINILGPLGKGFSIAPQARNLLLVAGGVGIAPLLFLAEQARAQDKSLILLLGASTANKLFPHHLMPDKIQTFATTEDGSAGKKGMVTDIVSDFLAWADQIFVSGPVAMYQRLASQKETRDKSIQVSLEVRLGCGLGACYGCTIKTKQGLKKICHDGPVFELNEIIWEEVRI